MVDFAPGLESAFASPPAEFSAVGAAVEGRLPSFLRGTAYWIGPARFERGGVAYRNWLDGDGMVAAVRFSPEGVRCTARFVRSDKWLEEEAAGVPIYRAFGTAFPGDKLRRGRALASPVNVSVQPFAGQLLAFGEQGLPLALDPLDLTTRGAYNFGVLNEVTPFSAHPAIDPRTGELFNFGVSFAAGESILHLFRCSPRGELLARSRVALDRPYSIHDFSMSARYAAFYLSPYLLDIQPLLSSRASVLDCLSWHPELGSRMLILDRSSGETVAKVPIGERYCLHHVNARDDGAELVVDVLELEEPVYPDYDGLPNLFEEVRPARTVRLRFDPAQGELRARQELGPGLAADFPTLDARRIGSDYNDFWQLAISTTGRSGRKFFDRLQRFDWKSSGVVSEYATSPPVYLGGEPVFVPETPGAESGVVLCPELDAGRRASSVVVLDAHDLARGPVARVRLPSPIQLAFHAAFVPESPA